MGVGTVKHNRGSKVVGLATYQYIFDDVLNTWEWVQLTDSAGASTGAVAITTP